MTSRIEAESTTFRDALRNFRRSASLLIYHFSDPELPFTAIRPWLDEFDAALVDFLRQETDNDRIAVMNKCLDAHVKGKDVDTCVDHVRSLIDVKVKRFADDVLKRETNFDTGKQSEFDKYKSMIETTKNSLVEFVVGDPPDFAVAARSIAELVDVKDVDWDDIDRVGWLFSTTCVFATAWKTLSAFNPPPQLTDDQVEIMKLKKKIGNLEQELKEKDAKIYALNNEKMTLKRQLINTKNENQGKDDQLAQLEKQVRIMQTRLQNTPVMKDALEQVAALVREEEKKPDGE